MSDDLNREPSSPETERVVVPTVVARSGRATPGARGPILVVAIIGAALAVVFVSIRPYAGDTADASLDPSIVAPISTEAAEIPTTSPAPADPSSDAATAVPTLESTFPPDASSTEPPTPKPVVTPKPTKHPPTVEVTDKPDIPAPTWTPPPHFIGHVTIYDRCLGSDGKEQIMVKGEWNSPVLITSEEFFLDGNRIGSEYDPDGEYQAWVATGDGVEIGTTHVGTVKFYAGPTYSDLIATLDSPPFTADKGAPC